MQIDSSRLTKRAGRGFDDSQSEYIIELSREGYSYALIGVHALTTGQVISAAVIRYERKKRFKESAGQSDLSASSDDIKESEGCWAEGGPWFEQLSENN